MAILPSLTAPHPFLKKKALPVTVFDAALAQTLRDMLDTMYDAKGIGLAAVQVGIAQRMLVMDVGEEGHGGADIMLEENMHMISGDKPIAAYGIHVTSSWQPPKTFGGKPGALMASASDMIVTFKGRGGHGQRQVAPIARASNDRHLFFC
jgi:hippurate hydrolase